MIKRLVLLVAIFVLSLSPSVLAAEAGNGTVEGQVVNGTEGGSSVAGQEVTLKTYLKDSEVGSTIKADAEGRFVFDGLSTEPSYSYQVTITFQGADYIGDWLSFADGETTKAIEVTVYDSTTSSEAIRVARAHTIIYVEPGSLQVVEYYLFVNEADRTYIGSKDIAGGDTKETLLFSLPEGATELQPTDGLMECCIYSTEDGFADSMPVLPGGKEVVYTYRVNHKSERYSLSRNVNYPTEEWDLLVQGQDVKVTGDRLTIGEPIDINGVLFNRLSRQAVAPGDTLLANISGLPRVSNQRSTLWVVLPLLVLGGGFGFVYLRKKGRLEPAKIEDSLDQRRRRLLVEIARLDDDFDSGRIPEPVYHRQRAERKAQLVRLMQASKKEHGN